MITIYVFIGWALALYGFKQYIKDGTMEQMRNDYNDIKDMDKSYMCVTWVVWFVCIVIAIVTWPIAIVWAFIKVRR